MKYKLTLEITNEDSQKLKKIQEWIEYALADWKGDLEKPMVGTYWAAQLTRLKVGRSESINKKKEPSK